MSETPSIVSIKAQSFTDSNGNEAINALLDMRRLKQIATDEGLVPITILKRTKEDNKERYGTHWVKPCLDFNIMRGTKIQKKVEELAEKTGIINEEVERKESEIGMDEESLVAKYFNS